MARYSFVTTWALEAAVDDVWDALYAVERRPGWWRGVRASPPAYEAPSQTCSS